MLKNIDTVYVQGLQSAVDRSAHEIYIQWACERDS